MFTVVGAGFGIYGYLPALVERFGDPVLLPTEYQPVVMARPELEPYRGHIRWVADIEAALAQASGAVIAVRPASQPEVVARCCDAPHITRIVLEKPVAVNPQRAGAVLDRLARSGKRHRIGYTLLDTEWSRTLEWPGEGLRIEWSFMAHHFAHEVRTWKRSQSTGGGVLLFFGVHLLALLSRHGYTEALESRLHGADPDEPREWHARFAGRGLPECAVHVNSHSDAAAFRILAGSAPLVDLADPFAVRGNAADSPAGDRRIPILAHLLGTFEQDDREFVALYRRTNALWQAVEEASRVAGQASS